MKKLVAILSVLLSGCAIASLLDQPTDLCEGIVCPPLRHCFPMFGQPYCIIDRENIEVCNLPCGDNQECRFGDCVSPDPQGKVCEFDDACQGNEVCILGSCTSLICQPGEVYPCYTGPDGTVNIGKCRGGEHLCGSDMRYSIECIGEVVPQEETGLLACNGRDDDCNGFIEPGDVEKVDIVFAFDLSGSMQPSLIAVSEAITNTAALYNYSSVRLGLVVFPTSREVSWIPRTAIQLSDYQLFSTVLNIFTNLIFSGSGGTQEASWDVVPMLVSNQIEDFSFRPNSKKVVILFTDENGQSYTDPKNDEESMCRAVDDNSIDYYVLTLYDLISDFDNCAHIYPLVEDSNEMVDNLSGIVNDICS
jgi:hypothetical protein